MSKESYIREMIPWAKKAEQATGLPYDFIVAQWGWETGWGTNRGSKNLNNHAGIKFSKYAPAGTVKDGMYAKYPSMDIYIQDYKRVMGLSYYTKIKSARTDTDRIKELNASLWSESDYDINTMLSAQALAKQYGEGITVTTPAPAPAPAINIGSELGSFNISNLSGLSGGELETWASVGIALAVLLTIIPRKQNA